MASEDRRRAAELRGAYHAGRGSDRHLADAAEQGRRDREAEHGSQAKADREKAVAKRPVRQTAPRQARPAAITTAPAPRRTPGYVQRAFSPTAAGRRLANTRPGRAIGSTVAAGDSGGLLLALVLYPVVLATVRYGAAGPGDWFRAKWLNQTTGQGSFGPNNPKPMPNPFPNANSQPNRRAPHGGGRIPGGTQHRGAP